MSARLQYEHALKYAVEEDKIFMLDKYKKWYPHIFDHTVMEIRPATPDDYYVPPTLTCRVVTKLFFKDKTACDNIGCFPFKDFGEPCEQGDSPQLSALGNTTTLSCQPMCRKERQIDTEWWDDRCVRVNPLKKLIVMFPERIFGRKSKHLYHNGLDWNKGQIAINADYCKAYGMEFNGYECTMTLGQKIAEIFIGTTIYRSIKTQNLQAVKPSSSKIIKMIYKDDPIIPIDISDEANAEQWAKEIAVDMSVDYGVSLGVNALENFLKKRAPKLIMKATSNLAVKKALTVTVIKNAGPMLAKSAVHLGKAIGVVGSIFNVYSIISFLVDYVDPNMYNYLLTGAMIDNLNWRLDVRYFQQEDNYNQEVTPDFVWEYILNLEDESYRLQNMVSNIEKYIDALKPVKQSVITKPPSKLSYFVPPRQNVINYWNMTMHLIVLGMLLTLTMIWMEWVHVWSFMVFLGIFWIAP